MNNIYHKFIDIPYDPGVDITTTLVEDLIFFKHFTINGDNLNPEMVNWFKGFDIKFNWYECFCTPPQGGVIPIHTDLLEISDIAKINWTWGAPGSTLIWWEVVDESKIVRVESKFGEPLNACEEQFCRKIYEKEITRPSLVNAGRFHSVYNPSTEKRWTLSLPIYDLNTGKRIQWPDAYERLKNYVIED